MSVEKERRTLNHLTGSQMPSVKAGIAVSSRAIFFLEKRTGS